MSDVDTAIRATELAFMLTEKLTKAAIKFWRNIYYSQHEGAASLRKLYKLCGTHVSYLEVATEDPAVLEEVKDRIFGDYHILYAELPDLRIDNKKQIAFSADQAESMRASINRYSAERLQKLSEAKEKYGAGSWQYEKAKAEIEKELPAVYSVTADDYALTRFEADGKTETAQYKRLAESAKETIEQVERQTDKAPITPFEERLETAKTAQAEADLKHALKDGKAVRLDVEPIEEVVDIAGQPRTFFHIPLDDVHSAVLTKSDLLDGVPVLVTDKKYTVVNVGTEKVKEKITKKTGEEIAKKATEEAAKTAAKTTAKVTAKAAANTNIYTAAAEKAISATVETGKALKELTRVKR